MPDDAQPWDSYQPQQRLDALLDQWSQNPAHPGYIQAQKQATPLAGLAGPEGGGALGREFGPPPQIRPGVLPYLSAPPKTGILSWKDDKGQLQLQGDDSRVAAHADRYASQFGEALAKGVPELTPEARQQYQKQMRENAFKATREAVLENTKNRQGVRPEGLGTGGGLGMARDVLGFVPGGSVGPNLDLGKANRNFEARQADAMDYEVLAADRGLKEAEHQRSTVGTIGRGALHVPGLASLLYSGAAGATVGKGIEGSVTNYLAQKALPKWVAKGTGIVAGTGAGGATFAAGTAPMAVEGGFANMAAGQAPTKAFADAAAAHLVSSIAFQASGAFAPPEGRKFLTSLASAVFAGEASAEINHAAKFAPQGGVISRLAAGDKNAVRDLLGEVTQFGLLEGMMHAPRYLAQKGGNPNAPEFQKSMMSELWKELAKKEAENVSPPPGGENRPAVPSEPAAPAQAPDGGGGPQVQPTGGAVGGAPSPEGGPPSGAPAGVPAGAANAPAEAVPAAQRVTSATVPKSAQATLWEQMRAEQQLPVEPMGAGQPGQLDVTQPLRPREPAQADYFRAPGTAGGTPAATAAVTTPVAPAEAAQGAAGNLRYQNAILQQKRDIAARVFHNSLAYYQGQIEAVRDPAEKAARFLRVMDPVETGQRPLPKPDEEFAAVWKDQSEQRTKALASRGLIDTFIDNYFTHLWKDPNNPNATPEEIGRKFGSHRPLAGREGFRKERTIPTYRDGIALGLEPVSWNPAELATTALDQMDKSIFGRDSFEYEKQMGRNVFVPLGKDAPAGFKQVDDKLWQVLAPGEVPMWEYYDKGQRDALMAGAQKLGVDVKTTMSGPPGKATRGGGIERRFATPNEVLAHEIGHQIDYRYGLENLWVKGGAGPIVKELQDLADARFAGANPSKGYQAYVRKGPEKIANLIAAYLHAPELLSQVAPHAERALDNFIQQHPDLHWLQDVKPSLVLGGDMYKQRLAGPMLTGHYYMPAEVAKLFENHMSQGLAGRSKAFDFLRGFGNQMVQFRLGTSAYHATFTALNAQFSALGEAIYRGTHGDIGEAAAMLPKGIVPLLGAEEATRIGKAMRGEWDSPGSGTPEIQEMVQWLKEAGGRAHPGHQLLGSQTAQFMRASRMIAAGDYGKIPEALARALPALNQLVSKPIMEYLVPLTKMGVFADAARYELGRLGPQATVEQKRAALGQIWDSMDYRFGQLTYDNLFWNRAVKEGLQFAMQSAGWNIGSVAEFGGAARDVGKGDVSSRKVAFTLATLAGTAAMGALYQTLATGQAPQDTKDYFFPKTGRKRPDGSDDRLSLPTYVKDLASIVNRSDENFPYQAIKNVGTTAEHKLNPELSMLSELFLRNEDYYGRAIRDPDDPIAKQHKDVLMHILQGFEPYSVKGFQQQRETGATPGQAARSLIGITPAPAYITRTGTQQQEMEQRSHWQLSPVEKKRRTAGTIRRAGQ